MNQLADLELLSQVVEAGSFVAAARHAGLSSSAVSKRIRRMEERLGVRLFNRTTRTVALTEAGHALYRSARDILDSVDNAEARVQALAIHPRGKLRIACSDAFASLIVVPMLATFSARYPDVEVVLQHGDGPLDLLQEQVDLAVRFEQPQHSNFVSSRLCPDPWVVCATPHYLEAHGRPECPADLSVHRCLTIEARGQPSNVWDFRKDDGQTDSIHVPSVFSAIGLVVKGAVLEGLGIARLANFLVRKELATGRLVPLLENYPGAAQRSIYIVYPHREFVPLKVRVFIDALRAAIKPL